MGTAVKQLAEQEHFATLAQLRSRTSAIMKFGADADNDPFVKMKDLITDFSRSQADASPETSQKSHCAEEASKATETKEDLGAQVAKHSSELLSVVYKNAIDSRRAAWRVITSIEQKEKSKGEEQLASYAREYIAKVENGLQKIREGVLALTDKKLIPLPSTDESEAFYYKMKSDYHRYLAEQDTEAPKVSSRDRISQHTMEQTLNVPVPEMVTQSVEVPKTISQNRIQQRTMKQIVDDPVVQIVQIPQVHVVEKTAEIPVMTQRHISRDGVQQRTVEQIVDAPVPQTVKELTEVFKVFSQDRIQQRAIEQTTPAIPLVEKTVEMPDTRTQDKTQHVVNTHAQHVVNTVEVERPKLTKETVQEKINQVTKQIKIPQVQFLNKVDDMLVDVQQQIRPMAQTVQKTSEIPQLQFPDQVVDVPVGVQRQMPMIPTVQKTMETPQSQCIDEMIDVPVVSVVQAPRVQVSEKTVETSQLQAAEKIVETRETQTIQGIQTSESLVHLTGPKSSSSWKKSFTESGSSTSLVPMWKRPS